MQSNFCDRHQTTTTGDGSGCLSCDKERRLMFPKVDEAAVLACVDRIKKAMGKEQPAVAMNACYMMMQAIEFLWLTEANQEKGHAE